MLPSSRAGAQAPPERLDRGRFTAVFFPTERLLATSLLDGAVRSDTFPGLPRPTQRVLLEVAPDKRRFREWVGPGAPEWGAAITFPESRRIVMQGRSSGSDAGVPSEVFRHELAHLALHEFLGDLPPRWFDEGYASYAAREWTRDDALAANLGLALRGTPTFDELDRDFSAGTMTAQTAYALAYRAVVELAALDPSSGLMPLFSNWREGGSLDHAVRSTYGITLADFEHRWRDRTRRRYGALALVSDAAAGGLLMLVVVFPLYVARRQRDRRRLAELIAADEAAEQAARSSVIEALLRGDDPRDFGVESPPSPPS
ncbi:MAG: peptidase MA family metallohydrolase [Gemmatimonadaceae bacterium]